MAPTIVLSLMDVAEDGNLTEVVAMTDFCKEWQYGTFDIILISLTMQSIYMMTATC
jgi:hypothetical protein